MTALTPKQKANLESKLARKKAKLKRLELEIDALEYLRHECQKDIANIEGMLLGESGFAVTGGWVNPSPGYTSAPTIQSISISHGGSSAVAKYSEAT